MRLTGFALVVLFALAGCGLSDYERRMDEQREKLRLLDEEETLLGDLIDLPSGKDAYGNEIKVPFPIFLRLPKGMSVAFKGPSAVYVSGKQPLFRYFGKQDTSVFVAMAKVKDKTPKTEPVPDEIAPEDFRSRVRGGLIDFVSREYKMTMTPPDFDKLKSEKREVLRDGKPQTLHLESVDFTDPRVQNPSRFYVYLQTLYSRQAALIYQVPVQAADQSWLRSMDVSLKTLDITSGAVTQRNLFRAKK